MVKIQKHESTRMYTLSDSQKTVITVLFFSAILCIGLACYPDYGISWDEPAQRTHGLVAAEYITDTVIPKIQNLGILNGIPDYPDYRYRGYVLFHLPIIFLEDALGLDPETPELWKLRHLYTFLWFFAGLIFFYKTLLRKYGWTFGLIGCLFMVLNPRIFAHSFYNVKDLAFLSALMIAIYFSFRYLERKDLASASFLALSLAVAINVRIIGLLFLALVIFFTINDWIKEAHKRELITHHNFTKFLVLSPLITALMLAFSVSVTTLIGFFGFLLIWAALSYSSVGWMKSLRIVFGNEFRSFMLLLFLTPLLTILFWPGAWEAPIDRIIGSFIGAADFTGWDGRVLYLGELVRGQEVPWHYTLVWMSVTTPIAYLILFIIGLGAVIKKFPYNKIHVYTSSEEKESIFCLLVFAMPVIAAILLNSTLYDGWRHHFFIYAPLIIISIKGLHHVLKSYREFNLALKPFKVVAFIICAITVLNTVYTANWMIVNHPYQYVYFNVFAGRNADYTYERDYWGLSAREGLEYIVNNDSRNVIRVYDRLGHIERNMPMISPEDQKRLQTVEKAKADYYIEVYRRIKGVYSNYRKLHSVEVNGLTIMSVFDLREEKEDIK